MAKKYLTLEEAAARLSISKDELVKMREGGEIRGFADRGNWKFKVDDIEELARSRSADSDPDVPIMPPGDSGVLDPDKDLSLGGESAIVLGPGESGLLKDSAEHDDFGEGVEAADSDVRLIMDSDLEPSGDESSLILGEAQDSASDVNLVSDADSDSDVMLVGGESDIIAGGGPADSESDVKLMADDDSDSDVKLVEPEHDSDSDVNLVESGDSDSDIKLAPVEGEVAEADEPTESDLQLTDKDGGKTDSDVRLVADEDSGSDISLAPDFGSDSDVRLVAEPAGEGSDSDVQLIDSGNADAKTSDSDIALISSDDSAISLDMDKADETGSVLADESGIALSGGSSITLASESGISLEGPTDSGISLDLDVDEGITLADDDDSGISLGEAGDSGIALAPDSGDFEGTMPMMETVEDDDVAETQFEIPSLSGEQEDDTSVIDLGDSDDETGVVDTLDDSAELDDAVFDVDDSAELDSLSDELELDDEFSDEDDLDVFEDEGEFEEGFQSGESHGELVVPTRAAAVETEWGTGPFVGLIVSTTLLLLVGLVMADLVHSMWAWNEPNAVAGALLGIFGGLF